MKYVTSEEIMGILCLFINLPFPYDDSMHDHISNLFAEKLPEHLYDAIEDIGFSEGDEQIGIDLATSNMDTVQSLAQELDKLIEKYVAFYNENKDTLDGGLDEVDRVLKAC